MIESIVQAFSEGAAAVYQSPPEWLWIAIALSMTLMNLWLLKQYLEESGPLHPAIPLPQMPIIVEEDDE